MRLIFLIAPLPVIFLTGWLHAWSADPDFSMDRSVGMSTEVVIGKLFPDGKLKEMRPFVGRLGKNASYDLGGGVEHFKAVAGIVGDSPFLEVVAFLDTSYPDSPKAFDLVTLTQDGRVCGRLHDRGPHGMFRIAIHPSWSRTEFLTDLDRSVDRMGRLKQILSRPASSGRVESLFQWMRDNIDWPKTSKIDPIMWRWDGHVFARCLYGVSAPSHDEKLAVAKELAEASSDDAQAMTLAVIANTPCAASLYDRILPYLDPSKSPGVRIQAARALMAADSYAGSLVLAKLLDPDDPEVDEMISAICEHDRYQWDIEPSRVHNADVLPLLLKFSDEALASSRPGEKNHNKGLGYSVPVLLQHYYHPQLVPAMARWANDRTTGHSAQAASHFRRAMVGDKPPPDIEEQLKQWRRQPGTPVSQHFDLTSQGGYDQWMKAWKEADNVVSTRLLLRL